MDIAKYIGLYLLKNGFCYIHGLGNLVLRKNPATYDGEKLNGPAYEVLLAATGSIDDNLANFIAEHEQISISKASNALRDFSVWARTELKEGRDVELPSLGKFVTTPGGKIDFVTDPHLHYTPPSIPVVGISLRQDEQLFDTAEQEHTRSKSTVNWGKIIIWALILGLIIAGIIYGIRFLSEQQQDFAVTPEPAILQEEVLPAFPEETFTEQGTAPDSLLQNDTTTIHENVDVAPPAAIQPAQAGSKHFEVVLNEYTNLERAQKRESQLKGYGHNVSLRTRDSSVYYLVLDLKTGTEVQADRVLDSLRVLFNPSGVSLYRH